MLLKGMLIGAITMILSVIVFFQLVGGKPVPGGSSWDARAIKSLAVSFFSGLGIGYVIVLAVVFGFVYAFSLHVQHIIQASK